MIDPKQNLFEISNVSELPREALLEKMRTDTFAAVRGLINPEDVKTAVKTIKEVFDPSKDSPARGEKPEDVRTNFQKVTLGGGTPRYNNYPRFLRTFYNPVWEKDIYNMHKLFRPVIEVRNTILGYPLEFTRDGIEDSGLWAACRVHQYPLGGGFFVGHRDTTIQDVADENSMDCYQVLLKMSQKGEDFDEGGAFVEINDQHIMLEDHFEVGDIIIYDGRTFHGVEDIDPHKKLDMSTINGRLAAFVSVYKS